MAVSFLRAGTAAKGTVLREPLPRPGPYWGGYPQRMPPAPPQGPWRQWAVGMQGWLGAWGDRLRRSPAAPGQRATFWLASVRAAQARWAARQGPAHAEELAHLRARLAREGFDSASAVGLQVEALGCVADAAQRSLQRNPFDTQLLAARIMLQGGLAEMATGEGKTLAAALVAAVAAMAGVPVHVMTVNDYLVQRDAQALAPLYHLLGLRVGMALARQLTPERSAAYGCEVTYCTAREVAFDWLRDRLLAPVQGMAPALHHSVAQLTGREPAAATRRLRGLCMAVLDEADSLLIDEAVLPLILSEPVDDAAQRAACFQALHLARQLQPGLHFRVDAPTGQVEWLRKAEADVEALAQRLGGAWLNRRHRQDLLTQALHALHLLQRDAHYLLRDGQVHLLDASTGRVSEGRRWSRSLHTLVELKEGLKPSPENRTVARVSVQRFFAHYVRLCGMSGTLAECRTELRVHYGLPLYRVPLRLPLQRKPALARLFASESARREACAARAQALALSGRAVLIGTASVASSAAMSEALLALQAPHRVLDARHDAEEAAIVAQAGQRGAITVATQMAGRGTDILLAPDVQAAGGLHVINCQDNTDARLDRQLHGRAGRQGEPGSCELWRALGTPGWRAPLFTLRLPGLAVRGWTAFFQGGMARRQRRQRLHLLQQELQWQHDLSFTTLRA